MPSIPQVATAMETVLMEQAHALARERGFIQCEQALTGAQFVQSLVVGWLEHPTAILEELVTMAAVLRHHHAARVVGTLHSRRCGVSAAGVGRRVLEVFTCNRALRALSLPYHAFADRVNRDSSA